MKESPKGYVPLKGSERRPAPHAKLLGPADPSEMFSVTMVLRRRPDGPPMPDLNYHAKTAPSQRRRLPEAEFAAKYGASPADIAAVTAFATAAGLAIDETSAVRRSVIVSGTVAQMEKAFGVSLGSYQLSDTGTYRGRDGFIHVPQELAGAVVGVFGLDNRNFGGKNGLGDPATTPR